MAFVRILCVSMITALSTLGSSSMALADDHTVTIYAWGDNYLTWEGGGSDWSNGIPGRLDAALRAEGVAVHIQVVNFEQSRVALKWLTKYGVGKDLLAHPDDHAVIMQVGHLDCLDFAPDSLQQTGAHLDQMLKVLSEKGIPVLVVGTGVLATCASDYDKVGYQQMFGDLATKYDALFYENLLDGVAGNPDLLLPDGGGSPNASGDAVIAVRLLPFVEKLVARAQKP